MKICLINNLYKPYNRGGAERIVELIADGLEKNGHKVCLITTKPLFAKSHADAPNFYYIRSLYRDLGKLPKFLRLFWHISNMFDIGGCLKVRSALKKEKPDIVMTHNLIGVGFLIPLAIKSLKIKHIHVMHDIQLLHPSGLMIFGREKIVDGAPARLYQKICRFLFGSPDLAISPSKWLLDLHSKKGFFPDSKKIILPNPAVCASAPAIGEENKNGYNFLYIGQIEKHKGILFLIRAFKKALRKGEIDLNSRLVIAGPGSEAKNALDLIKDCGNIEFLGPIGRAEVDRLMFQSSVLIIPSLCYENSPAVIYEAFASGLPVIGADLGGISELLGGRGLLFRPGNEEDLISKMRQAIDSRQNLIEMGANNRMAAIKTNGIDEYIKKIIYFLN